MTGVINAGMDEDWIVTEARRCRKSDVAAAKSWLIVGRTLYPRNVDIQFEMYQLEKSQRNVREAAKLFEEMTMSFAHEMRLWSEISAMSEALESDTAEENQVFLRDLFNALPAGLQRSMLLSAAESVTDTLHQCRLLLLVVNRYPGQVTEQGVKLVDLLLQAEKVTKCTSPVNCYRKYLACDVLPMLLRSGMPVSNHKHFFIWLEKALEFFVCYVSQPHETASHNASSGTSVGGLTDKESNITDPWNQLYQLMQMVASQLQWKIGRVLLGDNRELQWQQLNALYENLCAKTLDTGSGQCEQLFYISLVCFLRALHSYTTITQSTVASGNALMGHEVSTLVLVELFTTDLAEPTCLEHKAKKLKTEPEMPNISVSEGVAPDIIVNLTTAFRYWRLLHSEPLRNEFTRLCQQWSGECWAALQHFEVDACICQGLYQDALMRLQTVALPVSTPSSRLRLNLQMACCYYCIGNYGKACQLIIDIISSLTSSSDQPGHRLGQTSKSSRTAGRQLQLLSCTDVDVMSYCISLLIACLKDKAWKLNMDDILLGHMIILAQYEWPKYESLFCDVIRTIKKRGQFTYNLFFSYIIDIDMLEEFAYLWTAEGGRINLDIMPTSAKGIAQARTVTRGVNKVVKEDIKQSIERQVTRSNENVNSLIRMFLLDEAEMLKQILST